MKCYGEIMWKRKLQSSCQPAMKNTGHHTLHIFLCMSYFYLSQFYEKYDYYINLFSIRPLLDDFSTWEVWVVISFSPMLLTVHKVALKSRTAKKELFACPSILHLPFWEKKAEYHRVYPLGRNIKLQLQQLHGRIYLGTKVGGWF